ncbi:MAG TPA: hypothetical protein DCQ98_12825 [Planctomycetaceae bacterium]|nr:hypothetical protein [Planctomycetaceae bacterium]
MAHRTLPSRGDHKSSRDAESPLLDGREAKRIAHRTWDEPHHNPAGAPDEPHRRPNSAAETTLSGSAVTLRLHGWRVVGSARSTGADRFGNRSILGDLLVRILGGPVRCPLDIGGCRG